MTTNQTTPDFSGIEVPALGVFYLPARIEDDYTEPNKEYASTLQRYYYGGAAQFAARMPLATAVNVPNSQHHVHLVSPDELEQDMRDFFKRNGLEP